MPSTAIETVTETAGVVERDLRRLREGTGKVVGSVFYGAMLKAMRSSSIKGPYGHGGRGEEVFAAQLDARLARRMGEASKGGLAETLYRWLEGQQEKISELRVHVERSPDE